VNGLKHIGDRDMKKEKVEEYINDKLTDGERGMMSILKRGGLSDIDVIKKLHLILEHHPDRAKYMKRLDSMESRLKANT